MIFEYPGLRLLQCFYHTLDYPLLERMPQAQRYIKITPLLSAHNLRSPHTPRHPARLRFHVIVTDREGDK
jgi:hypothetical protein